MKKTDLGEKPIWQIWVASNCPKDNYTMLVQCDTEENYNEIITEIKEVIARNTEDKLNKISHWYNAHESAKKMYDAKKKDTTEDKWDLPKENR